MLTPCDCGSSHQPALNLLLEFTTSLPFFPPKITLWNFKAQHEALRLQIPFQPWRLFPEYRTVWIFHRELFSPLHLLGKSSNSGGRLISECTFQSFGLFHVSVKLFIKMKMFFVFFKWWERFLRGQGLCLCPGAATVSCFPAVPEGSIAWFTAQSVFLH